MTDDDSIFLGYMPAEFWDRLLSEVPDNVYVALKVQLQIQATRDVTVQAPRLLEKISKHKTKTKSLKLEAVSLLERCVMYQIPTPNALVNCFAELLGLSVIDRFGFPTKQREAFEAACRFEAKHDVDYAGGNPSTATVSEIARAAFPEHHGVESRGADGGIGDDRATIRTWRRSDIYRALVALYRELSRCGEDDVPQIFRMLLETAPPKED